MKINQTARGRGLALAALAACSVGATAQAAAPEQDSGPSVSIAKAGQSDTVRYGKRVAIQGTVAPASSGASVELQHAARGREFRPVASTSTAGDGSYSFRPKVRRTGSYRAVASGGGTSETRTVAVVARLAAKATRHRRVGQAVRVRGRLLPRVAGRTIRLDVRSGKRWRTVDRVRTGSGGRFRAAWKPSGPGSYRMRARFDGGSLAKADGKRLGPVRSYRAGHASWYGPGLYGNTLGCGGTLTPSTLGVAHKTLPCGTKVTFRYGGRSATVRVIDRGPYIGGREWDLTEATKQRLGFGSTGTVWSTK